MAENLRGSDETRDPEHFVELLREELTGIAAAVPAASPASPTSMLLARVALVRQHGISLRRWFRTGRNNIPRQCAKVDRCAT
jgi:hypothetical protein